MFRTVKEEQKSWAEKTSIYSSGLSYLQTYVIRSINTPQGPSLEEYKKLCNEGLHALVVRHPISRMISAWTDKFSWNSTAGAGFRYGLRYWDKEFMQQVFPEDYEFLRGMNTDFFIKQHGFDPNHLGLKIFLSNMHFCFQKLVKILAGEFLQIMFKAVFLFFTC